MSIKDTVARKITKAEIEASRIRKWQKANPGKDYHKERKASADALRAKMSSTGNTVGMKEQMSRTKENQAFQKKHKRAWNE